MNNNERGQTQKLKFGNKEPLKIQKGKQFLLHM